MGTKRGENDKRHHFVKGNIVSPGNGRFQRSGMEQKEMLQKNAALRVHYSDLSMDINAKTILPDNGAENKTRMRSQSPADFCTTSSLFQILFLNLTIGKESIPSRYVFTYLRDPVGTGSSPAGTDWVRTKNHPFVRGDIAGPGNWGT